GLSTFDDEELDYLFAILAPQKIKSYYDEFDYPSHILSAIAGHIARIRQERPEFATKIEALSKATVEEVLQMGLRKYDEQKRGKG
ncbi:MAG: hypothetical protein ACXACT_17840, partial [Candidatus Thorarchaeota archaeon]